MSTYSNIDVNELVKKMATESMLLVDVRNADEVARGVIAGAIHIPLALLPLQYDEIANADNVVFYCHSGVRSAHAALFAANKGCKQPSNLVGGVLAWAKAGQPFVPMAERNKN